MQENIKNRVLVLGLALGLQISISNAQGFDDLVVFGDSLSDTGNLASIQGSFPPPFFENRVSNGFLAVEVLAEFMGLPLQTSLHLVGPQQGTNYAVAGASARGDRPIDLSAQVGAFLLNNGGVAPDNALYMIFVGGNDVRDARDVGFKDARRVVREAVDSILMNVNLLASSGARDFIVVNVFDIGRVPDSSLIAAQTGQPFLPVKASWLSQLFNRKLSRKLRGLQVDTGIRLVEYDLFSFSAAFLDNPAPYNFSNTTDACFIPTAGIFDPGCENGANFDRFVFFDPFHPTAKSHNRIGRGLYSMVPEAAIE